ncbi:hypothetical protein [[Mycoplasma] testudinis]|uniref:hypothetical protein n=1 Tax=[Mycoplasma] testudinis TaxID=33924 RepID=UPI000484E0DF|nr:hypothetical protein [[Mycoplasma] testudinis]
MKRINRDEIIEHAKVINLYINQWKGFWFFLVVGICLVILFYGLSFTNPQNTNFLTIAGVAGALTVLLCSYLGYSNVKSKPKIEAIITILIEDECVLYPLISRKNKIRYKDIVAVFKTLVKQYNIPAETFKMVNKKAKNEPQDKNPPTENK